MFTIRAEAKKWFNKYRLVEFERSSDLTVVAMVVLIVVVSAR